MRSKQLCHVTSWAERMTVWSWFVVHDQSCQTDLLLIDYLNPVRYACFLSFFLIFILSSLPLCVRQRGRSTLRCRRSWKRKEWTPWRAPPLSLSSIPGGLSSLKNSIGLIKCFLCVQGKKIVSEEKPWRTIPVYFWILTISRDCDCLLHMWFKFDHVNTLVALRLHF